MDTAGLVGTAHGPLENRRSIRLSYGTANPQNPAGIAIRYQSRSLIASLRLCRDVQRHRRIYGGFSTGFLAEFLGDIGYVVYTVEIPSIGLISPTNRRRSAMVKSPGVFEGSVGFQSLPLSQR